MCASRLLFCTLPSSSRKLELEARGKALVVYGYAVARLLQKKIPTGSIQSNQRQNSKETPRIPYSLKLTRSVTAMHSMHAD